MLNAAFSFLADEFNSYLQRRTGTGGPEAPGRVVPGGLLDEKGNLAIENGTVSLSLVNIEEERVMREQAPFRQIAENGKEMLLQPELKLNLLLIFAARMPTYEQTLKALSYVLMFFQSHSVFTAEQYPTLDSSIGKIIMELYSVTPEVLNQIWASLGAKYQPSVLYKVRLVTIQDQEPMRLGEQIKGFTMKVGNR